VLKLIEPLAVVPIGWARGLFERRVLFSNAEATGQHSSKVCACKDSVMGDPVVFGCSFVIMEMLEVGSVLHS